MNGRNNYYGIERNIYYKGQQVDVILISISLSKQDLVEGKRREAMNCGV